MNNSETLRFKENLFLILFMLSLSLIAYGKFLKQSQVPLSPNTPPSLKINNTTLRFASPPQDIAALSYVVGEVNSSTILAQRNARLHLFPASITKLIAAMIVMDNFSGEQEVTISDYAVSTEGTEGDLHPQEKIKVKDLLEVMLLPSSNDAAVAFSEALRKEGKDPLALLRQKIEKLKMKNTAFFDFSGLDRIGNFSTAEDLFLASREIYHHYPLIGEILRKKQSVVFSSDGKYLHSLKNSNILVGKIKELWGGKTGTTPEARGCLLTIYEFPLPHKNDKIVITIVVLDSSDRFQDTLKLYQWVKDIIYQQNNQI